MTPTGSRMSKLKSWKCGRVGEQSLSSKGPAPRSVIAGVLCGEKTSNLAAPPNISSWLDRFPLTLATVALGQPLPFDTHWIKGWEATIQPPMIRASGKT